MANLYSNLPSKRPPNTGTSDGTVQVFNTYFTAPLELHVGTLNAMTGFFESRGFDPLTAKSIAVIIIAQADIDGYNPMAVLDNLIGLDGLQISELATQILNHNRYKTSFLGYTTALEPYHEIQRNIVDAAIPLPKSYSVFSFVDTVSEGSSVTFNIVTVNVRNGARLYWNLAGSTVTADDIAGGTTSGSVLINNGTASVILETLVDQLDELLEPIIFNLRTGSLSGPVVATATVSVANTSFEFVADYMIIEYLFTNGLDLDSRTKIVSPIVPGTYVGWGLSNSLEDVLTFGGDNTGVGTESTLFFISAYKSAYPNFVDVKIDCRAQWYTAVGTNPVGLKITLFRGGTMTKQGFSWVNPSATETLVFATTLQQITQPSQNPTSIGQRIAVLNYNTDTGQGFLDTADTTIY
jgi:hypothetical protein